MTKVMIPVFGWIYLHVVIDWGTRKLLSTHMSLTSKSEDWIAALNEAVNLQFPSGIKEASFIPELVSDHGCQPTSTAFLKSCSELGIHQIFASYSNPKDNADTERVIRTIKEDLVWTKEFDSVADFKTALKQWEKAYNEDYPHSSRGYMTPYEYERGSMLRTHKRVSDGVKASQKMKSSFFDCFYVMPPLTNGGHYSGD